MTGTTTTNQPLTTGYIDGKLGDLVDNSETAIDTFIADHTGTVGADGAFVKDPNGTLILSSSDALEMQRLMADHSITSQTATSTLKSVRDSISASARNI